MKTIASRGNENKDEAVVFNESSLKTGKCGMAPFFTSEKCKKRRDRKDDICKGCWMTE